MGDELFAVAIVLILVPRLRANIRIMQARADNDRTRQALNAWIESHPGISCSYSLPQRLIRERVAAWRAYIKACPALNDDGVMERYLESALEDASDSPLPYPMP